MILVHGFAPMPPLPSPSPFCVKLETWLRMAGMAYGVRADFAPFRAPKGRAPYVTLEDGSVVADSQHIVQILGRRPAVTLDDWLGPREIALTTLLQRTVEDHLYETLLYSRWIDPDGYRQYREVYWSKQGWFQSAVAHFVARPSIRRRLWLVGAARHRPSELWTSAERDLDALQTVLGDQPWFCGDRPSTADAIVYGPLASLHLAPIRGPLQDALRARPALVRWVERVRDSYWP